MNEILYMKISIKTKSKCLKLLKKYYKNKNYFDSVLPMNIIEEGLKKIYNSIFYENKKSVFYLIDELIKQMESFKSLDDLKLNKKLDVFILNLKKLSYNIRIETDMTGITIN